MIHVNYIQFKFMIT